MGAFFGKGFILGISMVIVFIRIRNSSFHAIFYSCNVAVV